WDVRRVFPVVAVASVALLALIAVLLQSGNPTAVAVDESPVRAIDTRSSVPVLLGAAYRADDAGAAPAELLAPSPSASPLPQVKKPKKPKAATKTRKARNVPDRPLDKHTGKRIVYDKKLMTVWLMNKKDEVVGRYPVVGRWDRPAKGTYRIFSKSEQSSNPNSKVTFNNMVRFTYGPDTKSAIGFHSIPRYYDGALMHPVSSLGLPIATGGCVRMSEEAAQAVYDFMKVGDLVVVLPSP
ncbi:MAG: L,D-transpeptidase, partial [Candidatus Nanopelagicales bacterium]|nr:L,D-transpeptidase [Candidatus Nanopelagicales bacterium]